MATKKSVKRAAKDKTKKRADATNATRSDPKNTDVSTKAATRAGEWLTPFIAALRKRGIVKDACVAAKVDRSTAYRHRESDTDFAALWQDALDDAMDDVEAEIHRRGVEGWEEPVFGSLGGAAGSGQIGTIRRYSDGLLQTLAKANRPSKFRDNVSHEHTGATTLRVIYDDKRVSDPFTPPAPEASVIRAEQSETESR